ncbi:MAG TPA: aspartate aminotransferase [Pseudomonas sp.]|nr:aspartate aminotransferase [Pseudomonas sp.]
MTIERLNTRLAQARPSATYRIIDRVAARRAEGASIISLCAGEPDFDTPEHIRQAGIDAIRNGHTRYTQVAGVRALREAVAQKFRRENGLDVTWQDTLVSNGGKHVIYNALAATLNAGDEVIVPAPYWVSYPEMVELCGGTARILPCAAQEGFKLTAAALEQAITPRTRWLILNSPSNPTGAVYSRLELQALAQVLLKHPHVLVLADDIYEHLLFGGQTFHTLAQVEPRLAPRVLTMNGVSKAYAMTGWRIGYAAGPADLIGAMATLQSQSTSNACSISQAAAVEALNGDQSFVKQSVLVYQQRRDRCLELLNAIPGLSCRKPDGAFYLYVNCAGLLGKTTPEGKVLHTDSDVVMYLLESQGVAVVAGTAYGLAPFFRMSIATAIATLDQGCARIATAVTALR